MKNSYFNKSQSRRKFLQDCGKMTSIGALSSMISLKMANKIFAARSAGSVNDYKGLVCLFMFGGNDSFNMLAPGRSEYGLYTESRQNLAIPMGEMHRIVDRTARKDFHIHRRMPGIKQLFDDGDLNFISNVGSLIEPTTIDQFRREAVQLPYGLYSHNDQIRQWQTSVSDDRSNGFGWGGRMLEILNDAANNNATSSVSISPWGNNTFQDGGGNTPFSVKGGVNSLELYNGIAPIRGAINTSLEYEYSSVLKNHHEHVRKTALEETQILEEIERNTQISTRFPATPLGRQLLQVAKYIKSQGILNANRQTFFVGQGGFDLHGEGLGAHNALLGQVNDALVAFNAAMKEIGYHDKVVTYTASDFGRSLSSNSGGSDHGWGGNQIVMGGPVTGGRVCGLYPTLEFGSSTDTGRGRQLPTTSVDELSASLAHWFGINNDNEMETVIPNIRNFWPRNSSRQAIDGMFT